MLSQIFLISGLIFGDQIVPYRGGDPVAGPRVDMTVPFNQVQKRFDGGQSPNIADQGLWVGRCYSEARPNSAIPSLVYFKIVGATKVSDPALSNSKTVYQILQHGPSPNDPDNWSNYWDPSTYDTLDRAGIQAVYESIFSLLEYELSYADPDHNLISAFSIRKMDSRRPKSWIYLRSAENGKYIALERWDFVSTSTRVLGITQYNNPITSTDRVVSQPSGYVPMRSTCHYFKRFESEPRPPQNPSSPESFWNVAARPPLGKFINSAPENGFRRHEGSLGDDLRRINFIGGGRCYDPTQGFSGKPLPFAFGAIESASDKNGALNGVPTKMFLVPFLLDKDEAEKLTLDPDTQQWIEIGKPGEKERKRRMEKYFEYSHRIFDSESNSAVKSIKHYLKTNSLVDLSPASVGSESEGILSHGINTVFTDHHHRFRMKIKRVVFLKDQESPTGVYIGQKFYIVDLQRERSDRIDEFTRFSCFLPLEKIHWQAGEIGAEPRLFPTYPYFPLGGFIYGSHWPTMPWPIGWWWWHHHSVTLPER